MADHAPATEISALATNVAIPDELQWTDVRRGEKFRLLTLTIRLLPDGRLAAKAYGRPVAGGRGAYVSFPVRDRPERVALVEAAASVASARWAGHRGVG